MGAFHVRAAPERGSLRLADNLRVQDIADVQSHLRTISPARKTTSTMETITPKSPCATPVASAITSRGNGSLPLEEDVVRFLARCAGKVRWVRRCLCESTDRGNKKGPPKSKAVPSRRRGNHLQKCSWPAKAERKKSRLPRVAASQRSRQIWL